MSSSYPSSKQVIANPAAGTSKTNNPSHFTIHTQANDTLGSIQDTVGTTLGTNVLMNFAAGQFPVRNTGGGATGTLVQTLVGGTLTSTVINPVTSNTAKFRAYVAGSQSLVGTTSTLVQFNTENFDTGSNYDNATYLFTAPVTGYYQVTGQVILSSLPADTAIILRFNRNSGTIVTEAKDYANITSNYSTTISDLVQLTAADTLGLYIEHLGGTNNLQIGTGVQFTYFTAHLLSI